MVQSMCTTLNAQDYQVEIRQITPDDGLLHREVNAIYQDQNNFVWIASLLGIHRYDGYWMKTYTARSHGLQNNNCQQIREDHQGRIWFIARVGGNMSGAISSIDIYLPEKDVFVPFEAIFSLKDHFQVHDLQDIFISKDLTTTIFQPVNKGKIFILTNEQPLQVLSFQDMPDFELKTLSPEPALWGSMDAHTLVKLNLQGKILKKITFQDSISFSFPLEQTFDGFRVNLHHKNQYKELAFIDWQGNEFTHSLLHEEAQAPSRPKFSLFATSLKPMQYAQVNQDITGQFVKQLQKIEGGAFRNYYHQKRDFIWAGGNYGAYLIRLKQSPFQTYFSRPFNAEDKVNRLAGRGIWVQNNRMLVNLEPTWTYSVDLNSGEKKRIDLGACGENTHLAIALWKNGEVLLSAFHCLIHLDSTFQLIGQWEVEQEADIWAIFPANEKEIWLGLGEQKGIALLNVETGEILTSANHPAFQQLERAHVMHIMQDKHGRMAFCSNKGFFIHDEKEGTFQAWNDLQDATHYLPARDFLHAFQDADEVFWLGTRGQGLIRWDEKKQQYQQFTREEGLPDNMIYGIYEDDHEHLWMPSDHGIIQFDKNNFSSKNYLPADGTSEMEFNRISHTQDEKGRLYFGSINGITAFHPDDFYTQEKDEKPELRLQSCQVMDLIQDRLLEKTGDVQASKEIVMKPHDRYARLELSLMNYALPGQNQFLWQIEGLDKDWQVQFEPFIQIGRIPYGKYKLRIKGRTAKGLPSANEIILSLKLVPPFYQKTSFILLVVFAFILVIPLIVFLRFRQLRISKERLEQRVEQATEELREMDRLKSRLFSNVSHELRTPLSLILGPINTVLKRFPQEKQAASYLELARNNGQKLQQLITEILDLGKLESGKLQLQEKSLDFSAFIQKLSASFHALAETQQLDFQVETDFPADSHILCDKAMLERILNNLLSNAIKFTPRGGRISLQGTVGSEQSYDQKLPTANYLLLTVSDTGPGIHADDLPHIFDRYYQARENGESWSGGTGIGLALSKELAELMGGTLSVASVWGQGTTFRLLIPWKPTEATETVVTPEEVHEAKSPSLFPKLSEQSSPSANILIVEDNDDLRQYLESLLTPYFRVVTARNGKEGLEKLEELFSIDLVLTDLMMPQMDGMALLDAMKKDQQLRQLPVVMLTAKTGLTEKLQALRLGVHDYLTKPFEEEELLARIENLLAWAKVRTSAEASPEPEMPTVSYSHEEEWLEKINTWLKENFQETNIKISDWAEAFHISESHFRRKLKQLTGLTPQQYLQEYRLKTARQLLERQAFPTVAQVAVHTGFSTPDYFSTVFQKRFGKLPSAYLIAS